LNKLVSVSRILQMYMIADSLWYHKTDILKNFLLIENH
jgi:hypothetical protein